MVRAEGFRKTETVFAPLVGKYVNCPRLEVARIKGKRLEPVLDAEGRLIELHASEEMRDLIERIPAAGRYRVTAREPDSDEIIGYVDYRLEPAQGPPRRAPPRRSHAPPAPAPAPRPSPMAASEHGFIAHLHETINTLRDQLRELTARAERDVRYERERADERVRLMQEKCEVTTQQMQAKSETATRQAHDAEVKVASFSARLEAREQRVGELEAQLAEMKAEVEGARELAAELRLKAEESEFSPLDALLQMDQALDVIGKTAERFTQKK